MRALLLDQGGPAIGGGALSERYVEVRGRADDGGRFGVHLARVTGFGAREN
jgi:hypothetical protein